MSGLRGADPLVTRVPGRGGVVLTLSFEADDRFVEAAAEWGEQWMQDEDEALETKAEQALLEIEHLASNAHEVEFRVEGRTIHHEPSDGLSELLARQAEETGLDESTLLKLHADLFTRAFLDDGERPPNAPPTDG